MSAPRCLVNVLVTLLALVYVAATCPTQTGRTKIYCGSTDLVRITKNGLSGTYITLSINNNQKLTDISVDALQDLRMLQTVIIKGNGALQALRPGIFANLDQLRALYLTGNNLQSLPQGIFNNLALLSNLSLYDNQLTFLSWTIFSDLESLTRLNVSKNLLPQLDVNNWEKNTKLVSLDLSYNQIKDLPAAAVQYLTTVKDLHLDNNQMEHIAPAAFATMEQLEHVYLENNQLRRTTSICSLARLLRRNINVDIEPDILSAIQQPLQQMSSTCNGGTASTLCFAFNGLQQQLFCKCAAGKIYNGTQCTVISSLPRTDGTMEWQCALGPHNFNFLCDCPKYSIRVKNTCYIPHGTCVPPVVRNGQILRPQKYYSPNETPDVLCNLNHFKSSGRRATCVGPGMHSWSGDSNCTASHSGSQCSKRYCKLMQCLHSSSPSWSFCTFRSCGNGTIVFVPRAGLGEPKHPNLTWLDIANWVNYTTAQKVCSDADATLPDPLLQPCAHDFFPYHQTRNVFDGLDFTLDFFLERLRNGDTEALTAVGVWYPTDTRLPVVCQGRSRCGALPVENGQVLGITLVQKVAKILCNVGYFGVDNQQAPVCWLGRNGHPYWNSSYTCQKSSESENCGPEDGAGCVPTRTGKFDEDQICDNKNHIRVPEAVLLNAANWKDYESAKALCKAHGATLPQSANYQCASNYLTKLKNAGVFSQPELVQEFYTDYPSVGGKAVTSLRNIVEIATKLPVVCEYEPVQCPRINGWWPSGKLDPPCKWCNIGTWYNKNVGVCQGPQMQTRCSNKLVFIPLQGLYRFIQFGSYLDNEEFCQSHNAEIPPPYMALCVAKFYKALVNYKYQMFTSKVWIQADAVFGGSARVDTLDLRPSVHAITNSNGLIATFACTIL